MKQLLLLTIISCLFFRCTTSTQETELHNGITEIDLTDCQGIVLSDYFEKVAYIPLEATDESLIGDIVRLIHHDGLFYTAAGFSDNSIPVKVFDVTGKYIRSIGSIGNGPGEYKRPADFAVNTTHNEIIINDFDSRRALVYDLEGKFLRDFDVDFFPFGMASAGDYIYWKRNFNNWTNEHLFNLIITDLDANIVKELMPYGEEMSQLYSNAQSPHVTQDIVRFVPILEDKIYDIVEDSVMARYQVRFARDLISIEEKEKNLDESFVRNHALIFVSFLNGHGLLQFQYTDGGEYMRYIGINGTRADCGKVDNDLEPALGFNPITFMGNKVVGYHTVSQILSALDENAELKNIFPDFSDDSNPVLAIYTLKD